MSTRFTTACKGTAVHAGTCMDTATMASLRMLQQSMDQDLLWNAAGPALQVTRALTSSLTMHFCMPGCMLPGVYNMAVSSTCHLKYHFPMLMMCAWIRAAAMHQAGAACRRRPLAVLHRMQLQAAWWDMGLCAGVCCSIQSACTS